MDTVRKARKTVLVFFPK